MDSSSQSKPSPEDDETATDEFTCQSDDDLYPSTRAPLEVLHHSVGFQSSYSCTHVISYVTWTRVTVSLKFLKSPSMKKFQGVDVGSDLVPYLRKLWKKDDFVDGNAVRSNGLLTWAFESLAKMMIILQNNKGKGKSSLSETQAEYLKNTLIDLQSMKFRLDWLVPIVEKTTARYTSKEPGDVVMELQVERNMLHSKLHKVEEKLNEQEKLMTLSQCSLRH
uniref:Uncharacterized protein n=1 Tax=Chenopodium quinoa TaxID=63459 RepID=A0A803L8B5_CHEQI